MIPDAILSWSLPLTSSGLELWILISTRDINTPHTVEWPSNPARKTVIIFVIYNKKYCVQQLLFSGGLTQHQPLLYGVVPTNIFFVCNVHHTLFEYCA